MYSAFGDFTGNITIDTSVYPYIVTMNTSWLPENLKLRWLFEANHTTVADAIAQAYVTVRDIRADLDILVSENEIKTDLVSYFNFTVKLYDIDNNRQTITNGTGDPKYEDIKFWIYDATSGNSSYSNWGRNFAYGE